MQPILSLPVSPSVVDAYSTPSAVMTKSPKPVTTCVFWPDGVLKIKVNASTLTKLGTPAAVYAKRTALSVTCDCSELTYGLRESKRGARGGEGGGEG